MKIVFQPENSNEYMTRMFFGPLRSYMADQGFQSHVENIDEQKDAVVIVHGDLLSPERIRRIKEAGNILVVVDINDSSYLSSSYIHSPEQELCDLIFKVSGIPRQNEVNERGQNSVSMHMLKKMAAVDLIEGLLGVRQVRDIVVRIRLDVAEQVHVQEPGQIRFAATEVEALQVRARSTRHRSRRVQITRRIRVGRVAHASLGSIFGTWSFGPHRGISGPSDPYPAP